MNEFAERLRRMIESRDRAVLVGAVVSVAWLLLVLLFWLLGPEGAPASGVVRLVSVLGVLLPFALIWMAVGLAGTLADLRAEAVFLRARLDILRDDDGSDGRADGRGPEAGQQRGPAGPAANPSARRPAASDARMGEPAPEPPPPVRVSPVDLVAALNFPDGPDDHEAIAALRAALADPDAARAIRAAQDVVTLLAKHGVYTDDLQGASSSPVLWRRFVEGQRGQAVAGLASPGDAEAIEMTAGLMRGDEVFRDAAQHFLRQYDRALARVADEIGDDGLAALATTRSGRAFGLLAQVTGMFG